jgi:ankyrin repeat protein
VKALFREIRAGDVGAVAARLGANPDLVHAIAKAPPKKDDGQSTLQVAIKAGRFEVANLLLDAGADVNYRDVSELNRWNTPVLHDAVRAAVFSSRFGNNWALPGEPARIEVLNTGEQFDRAFSVLERMISLGADPLAHDSAGNPALWRAVLDARQVLRDFELPDLDEDLRRVFDLLLQAGADPDYVHPTLGKRAADGFADEPVRRFLS